MCSKSKSSAPAPAPSPLVTNDWGKYETSQRQTAIAAENTTPSAASFGSELGTSAAAAGSTGGQ